MTSNLRAQLRLTAAAGLLLGVLFDGPLVAGSFCGNPIPPCDPNNPASPCFRPPPPDPRCKVCNQCAKSPCNVGSGVYENEATDLAVKAVGVPLAVTRAYLTSRAIDGPLGYGWTTSLSTHVFYTTYLLAAPSTVLVEADVTMPSGAHVRFRKDGATFEPPAGRHDRLIRENDGTFRLTLQKSRVVYLFSAAGDLMEIKDEFGNATQWLYGTDGRLQTVLDVGSARYLSVVWGADGRISTVQDSGGRTVRYEYNADGTLSRKIDPALRSTEFEYASVRSSP